MAAYRMLLLLYDDEPAAGDWNMALDQAMLEDAARGVAALRLYGWSVPTLSLGYFQRLGDRSRHGPSQSAPVVRRWSGGGAILHDHEWTYSLALPLADASRAAHSSARQLFHVVQQTLADALGSCGVPVRCWSGETTSATNSPADSHGRDGAQHAAVSATRVSTAAEPFLCFERRGLGDLVIADDKVVGSAQRRWRGAVLQHGSVLWRRSALAPELPGIEDLVGRPLDAQQIRWRWVETLANAVGARWEPGQRDEQHWRRAEAIRRERFGSPSWTGRR